MRAIQHSANKPVNQAITGIESGKIQIARQIWKECASNLTTVICYPADDIAAREGRTTRLKDLVAMLQYEGFPVMGQPDHWKNHTRTAKKCRALLRELPTLSGRELRLSVWGR
jgi:hypothetical protein